MSIRHSVAINPIVNRTFNSTELSFGRYTSTQRIEKRYTNSRGNIQAPVIILFHLISYHPLDLSEQFEN